MSIDWGTFTGWHVAAFSAGAGLALLEKRPTLQSCTHRGVGYTAVTFAIHTAAYTLDHANSVGKKQDYETSRSEMGRDLNKSFAAVASCLGTTAARFIHQRLSKQVSVAET